MPGTAGIERVDRLACLEEDIRVLGSAAQDGMFGGQGPGAVGADQFVIDHGAQVIVSQLFDLVDLVRGAEAVEEVQERDARLQGWQPGRSAP